MPLNSPDKLGLCWLSHLENSEIKLDEADNIFLHFHSRDPSLYFVVLMIVGQSSNAASHSGSMQGSYLGRLVCLNGKQNVNLH